ncbi:MAG: cation:proton antiporter [Candidatus Peribacteria bacterium]|nr:MAG: cation:proton antiporter [Candidatus Peribacteria bacterium]
MLILISFALISAMQSSGGDISIILQRLGTIALAIVITRLVTKYFLPKLVQTFSSSEEYLLLFSVGRALIVAAGFQLAGLSMEAGALIAGMALAESSEKFLIVAKIKTLRDFFIALFFIYMGSNLIFDNMGGIRLQVIVLSLFVLIGNPLIVFLMMKHFHYDRRTSFMTGLTVAQISEFSFIVTTMGLSL